MSSKIPKKILCQIILHQWFWSFGLPIQQAVSLSYMFLFTFLALCIFDFLVVVTVILLKGIPTIDENHSLKLLLPVVHPLMNLTWMMSIYLTVLLAIERFMVICWTNLKTKYYTKKGTKVYLVFTFVFVAIYNIPKCMEYTWETQTIRTGKGSLISEFGPMCEEVGHF